MTAPRRLGPILLSIATLLWGTTFVVTRGTLDGTSPAAIVFGRFAVAAILLSPSLSRDRKVWLAAAELGALLWIGFATQTVGLRYTTVARSAFITSSCVVMVPVFAVLVGKIAAPRIWLAAVAAVGGLYLLCHDQAAPNRGDAWTLLCAAGWGIYILRLEVHTTTLPTLALSAAQVWVVTIMAGAWWIFDHAAGTGGPVPWLAVGYLGVAATAATTLLQAVGQRTVPAARAAILFTMEPVWATLIAYPVRGEKIGLAGMCGAAVIVVAAVVAQLPVRGATAGEPDADSRTIGPVDRPRDRSV
jgi:drug/metabolite transporter (DMT)-like permease